MRRTFFNSGDIETIMDVLRMSIVEESKQNDWNWIKIKFEHTI
jgi:hypothetical protein